MRQTLNNVNNTQGKGGKNKGGCQVILTSKFTDEQNEQLKCGKKKKKSEDSN